MAKGKRKGRAAPKTTTKIIRASSPAPVIKVQTSAPRAIKKRRSGGRRRRSGFGAAGGHVMGIVSNETLQMGIGGLAYGFLVKSGIVAKLPAIPILGRTGTAAVLLDWWSRRGGGPWPGKAARAAAAIAGYQLGHEGTITGDFLMGSATTPGGVNADEHADGYEPPGFDPIP